MLQTMWFVCLGDVSARRRGILLRHTTLCNVSNLMNSGAKVLRLQVTSEANRFMDLHDSTVMLAVRLLSICMVEG